MPSFRALLSTALAIGLGAAVALAQPGPPGYPGTPIGKGSLPKNGEQPSARLGGDKRVFTPPRGEDQQIDDPRQLLAGMKGKPATKGIDPQRLKELMEK